MKLNVEGNVLYPKIEELFGATLLQGNVKLDIKLIQDYQNVKAGLLLQSADPKLQLSDFESIQSDKLCLGTSQTCLSGLLGLLSGDFSGLKIRPLKIFSEGILKELTTSNKKVLTFTFGNKIEFDVSGKVKSFIDEYITSQDILQSSTVKKGEVETNLGGYNTMCFGFLSSCGIYRLIQLT